MNPIDDDGYQRWCDEQDEARADYPPGWDADPDEQWDTTEEARGEK